MPRVQASKKKVDWATKENFTDCGVFVMRHMEMYQGTDGQFDCGFSNKESEQRAQIVGLRMKYGARILLSDVNVLKQNVMGDAKAMAEANKTGIKRKR